MKKIVRRTITLELNEEDVKLMVEILNYVWHRASKHDTYVTKYKGRIDQMRAIFASEDFNNEPDTDIDIFNN